MENNSGLKVVIVEDNEFFSSMIKMFIDTRFETDAQVFNCGEQMLSKVIDAPDIVFLDYQLDTKKSKNKNGKAILEIIKKKFPHSLVVMLSSQNSITTAIDLLKAGACDYIVKNEEAIKNIETCIENLVYLLEAKYQRTINNRIVKKDVFRLISLGLAFAIVFTVLVKMF